MPTSPSYPRGYKIYRGAEIFAGGSATIATAGTDTLYFPVRGATRISALFWGTSATGTFPTGTGVSMFVNALLSDAAADKILAVDPGKIGFNCNCAANATDQSNGKMGTYCYFPVLNSAGYVCPVEQMSIRLNAQTAQITNCQGEVIVFYE